MAGEFLSIYQTVADGSSAFEFNFAGGYLSRDHVKVLTFDSISDTGNLEGLAFPDFTFIGDYTLSIPNVPVGKTLRIYRDTPFNLPLVDFSDGSVISEKTLDINAKQAVFIAAELRDRFGSVIDLALVTELVNSARDAANVAKGLSLRATSKDNLASLIGMVAGSSCALLENGAVSQWDFFTGTAPDDPLRGLTIPGVGGYWKRRWDGIHAKPEWWGARKNDPTAAAINVDAIYAAINCGSRITVLESGDYHTNRTLFINTADVIVKGSGLNEVTPSTRILCRNLTNDVIQVGSARNVGLEYLSAGWSSDPIIGSRSDEGREAAPKAFVWLDSPFPRGKNLFSVDAPVAFYFHGTFSLILDDCRAMRTKPLPGDQDFFIGYWVRGHPRVAAGGNASITLNGCWAGSYYDNSSGATFNPYGFYVDSNWADTFLLHCETVNLNTGLEFNGANNSGDSFVHGDVLVDHMTIDQSRRGIIVNNMHPLGRIKINNSYVQVNDRGGGLDNAAVLLQGGNGKIVMSNTEIVGPGDATTNNLSGVWIHGQPNVVLADTVLINGFGYPVTIDGPSPRCTVKCNIEAGPLGLTGKTAVRITSGNQLRIEPAVGGIYGAFVRGIEFLGNNHENCEVSASQIDRGCVAGQRLDINGIGQFNPGYIKQDGTPGGPGDFGILITGFL